MKRDSIFGVIFGLPTHEDFAPALVDSTGSNRPYLSKDTSGVLGIYVTCIPGFPKSTLCLLTHLHYVWAGNQGNTPRGQLKLPHSIKLFEMHYDFAQ